MTQYSGSGGTDVANMVLFWPAHLPADAATQLAEQPLEFTETLREEGRVIWFLCDGDGSYHLTVYVDEQPPAQLREFLGDEEHYPQVQVQGKTLFCGLEFLHDSAKEAREERPEMCATLEIPEGVYQAKVYRTHLPPSFSRHWLMKRLGARRYRMLHWQHLLSKASMFGVFGVLLSFFFLTWPVRLGMIGVVVLTFLAAVYLARSEACQEAIEAIDEFSEEYPEYVVVLKSPTPEMLEEPESAELAMPVG